MPRRVIVLGGRTVRCMGGKVCNCLVLKSPVGLIDKLWEAKHLSIGSGLLLAGERVDAARSVVSHCGETAAVWRHVTSDRHRLGRGAPLIVGRAAVGFGGAGRGNAANHGTLASCGFAQARLLGGWANSLVITKSIDTSNRGALANCRFTSDLSLGGWANSPVTTSE